jgi:hypothetical protein
LITLLDSTCVIVALLLDGWTSQNDISIFTVNGTWLDSNFKVYRACFDFYQIKGEHLGEHLAKIVYNIGKRLNILLKIISVTRDNALNNDTLCRYLYNKLSKEYNSFKDDLLCRGQFMRFDREDSQIQCLAHVLNLVYKDILKSLGSSTHIETKKFIERTVENSWKEITVPLASGNIYILKILVLWIA